MKYIKKIVAMTIVNIMPMLSWALGTVTVEGVGIQFQVISDTEKICETTYTTNYSGAVNRSIDRNYAGTVTIPEEVDGYKVVKIGDKSFAGCSLSALKIPNTVKEIGIAAFDNCTNLSSVSLGDGLEVISLYAFRGCTSLESVIFPTSTTTIGPDSFSGCTSLKTIQLPYSLEQLYQGVFAGCSELRSVSLPSSLKIVHPSSFSNCSKLASIIIPQSIEKIEDHAFSNCESLTNVEIPEGVTSIGSYAFGGCSNLTSITLPKTLKTLVNEAFRNCIRLKSVKAYMDEPFAFKYESRVFANPDTVSNRDYVFSGATLYVPKGTKALYQETDGWKLFPKIIEMITGDANGDGVVNNTDITAIAKYIIGKQTEGIDYLADVNNDGVVNVSDVVTFINKSQTRLPISGHNVSFVPAGAVDLEFDDDQQFLLSELLEWNDGDSYTVLFKEATQVSDIMIGDDVIPVGVTTFQGFNPEQKRVHWQTSNGQYFEKNWAWIRIKSASLVKLQIKEVLINKADGKTVHCSYPYNQCLSSSFHVEADNGEEFEQYVEVFCNKPTRIDYYSGKVTFSNASSYIGGADWVGVTNDTQQYHLLLNSPTTTNNFAWKYVSKDGETHYQQIERNTIASSLDVNEEIKECYIVSLKDNDDSHNDILDIQKVSVQTCLEP